MNKKLWILLSIVLLGLVALGYVWLKPNPLEREYNSVVYSYDTGVVGSIPIKLKGERYRSLLGKKSFVGELTADNDLNYKIVLKENDQQYFGTIVTFDAMNAIHTLGTVMASKKLDKVWLKLEAINQKYQLQDGYISGPTNSLEEAEQIAREVLSGDGV